MQIVLDEVKKNDNFLFARIDYKKNRPQIDIKIDKDKVSNWEFQILKLEELLNYWWKKSKHLY